jgi:hypothetical protein
LWTLVTTGRLCACEHDNVNRDSVIGRCTALYATGVSHSGHPQAMHTTLTHPVARGVQSAQGALNSSVAVCR